MANIKIAVLNRSAAVTDAQVQAVVPPLQTQIRRDFAPVWGVDADEVADACEADAYGYSIDGTLVSDFVYPAWFEDFRPEGSAQFDYGNRVTRPFEVLPGGYIGVFDVGGGSGWAQITAEGQPRTYAMRPRVGSRRERRRTPRDEWLNSQP